MLRNAAETACSLQYLTRVHLSSSACIMETSPGMKCGIMKLSVVKRLGRRQITCRCWHIFLVGSTNCCGISFIKSMSVFYSFSKTLCHARIHFLLSVVYDGSHFCVSISLVRPWGAFSFSRAEQPRNGHTSQQPPGAPSITAKLHHRRCCGTQRVAVDGITWAEQSI